MKQENGPTCLLCEVPELFLWNALCDCSSFPDRKKQTFFQELLVLVMDGMFENNFSYTVLMTFFLSVNI